MKLWTTAAAAIFALMMAMPGASRADVGNVHPQTPQPAFQQTALAPQPLETLAYYHRPWACSNPHFRRHHWWLCR
jgi:hypothetical protein